MALESSGTCPSNSLQAGEAVLRAKKVRHATTCLLERAPRPRRIRRSSRFTANRSPNALADTKRSSSCHEAVARPSSPVFSRTCVACLGALRGVHMS